MLLTAALSCFSYVLSNSLVIINMKAAIKPKASALQWVFAATTAFLGCTFPTVCIQVPYSVWTRGTFCRVVHVIYSGRNYFRFVFQDFQASTDPCMRKAEVFLTAFPTSASRKDNRLGKKNNWAGWPRLLLEFGSKARWHSQPLWTSSKILTRKRKKKIRTHNAMFRCN